jgi:hypothetical protein
MYESYPKRIQSSYNRSNGYKNPGKTDEIGKHQKSNDFPKTVIGVTAKTVLCIIFFQDIKAQ